MSYEPATSPTGTATITPADIDTSLSVDPLVVDAKVGAVTMFTGKLTETTSGNPIQGKIIHLFIDGVDTGESAVTDVNGDYSINHTWTTEGTFKYETRYLGD